VSSAKGRAPAPVAEGAQRRSPSGAPGEHQSGGADALDRFIEPGRRAFELSLAFCALSLLFPWLVFGAMTAAGRAWQRGSRRAWLAIVAAAWCCLLGLAVREYLGLGVFP
jgi:hypothetical protein